MEPSSPLRARLPSSFIPRENIVRQSAVASDAGQLKQPSFFPRAAKTSGFIVEHRLGHQIVLLVASAMTTCMGDAK